MKKKLEEFKEELKQVFWEMDEVDYNWMLET